MLRSTAAQPTTQQHTTRRGAILSLCLLAVPITLFANTHIILIIIYIHIQLPLGLSINYYLAFSTAHTHTHTQPCNIPNSVVYVLHGTCCLAIKYPTHMSSLHVVSTNYPLAATVPATYATVAATYATVHHRVVVSWSALI